MDASVIVILAIAAGIVVVLAAFEIRGRRRDRYERHRRHAGQRFDRAERVDPDRDQESQQAVERRA